MNTYNDIWCLLVSALFLIGLACCIFKMLIVRMNYMISERCRFVPYLRVLKCLKKFKVNNANANIHFALLKNYIILGMYSEAEKEVIEINSMEDRLSELQKVELSIWKLGYLKETGQENLENKIQDSLRILEEANLENAEIKERFQRTIYLHQYMNNQEWDAAIDILRQIREKTVYEQVEKAYLLGVCYLKKQKYTEASGELAFVIKNGGDTEYVSLANELIDKNSLKIEKTEKEVIKNNELKIRFIKYFALGLLCLGGFLFTNFFNFNCMIKGNTTLETYAKNYHVNAEDVDILYQQELEKGELVILEDNQYIIYILSEKTGAEGESSYRICQIYRVSIEELLPDYSEDIAKIDEMSGDAEFTLKTSAGQEIWQVFKQFYKKEDIFYTDGFDCVGISYYSNVEDIEIAGRKVDIEETIEIHGKNAYIWKVDNIDLENVTYLDFDYE